MCHLVDSAPTLAGSLGPAMKTGLLPENKSRGSSSDDDAMGDEQAMEYDGRQPAASEAEPSAAAEQRCGCSDAKTIEVIAVGQNVLAVILARAWADLLFEVLQDQNVIKQTRLTSELALWLTGGHANRVGHSPARHDDMRV